MSWETKDQAWLETLCPEHRAEVLKVRTAEMVALQKLNADLLAALEHFGDDSEPRCFCDPRPHPQDDHSPACVETSAAIAKARGDDLAEPNPLRLQGRDW